MTPVKRSQGRGRRPGPPLSARAQAILAAVVRTYIDRGEPVSSLWLARHGGFGVSSATVRSTMAELEEAGYVQQPHASSGRVPTDLGYRCHVDTLLRARRPSRRSPLVEAKLRRAGTVDDLLVNVSHELSRVSHHLGFALAPPNEAVAFRHIDFVRLESGRALVVLVSAAGQVSHKVVQLDRDLRPEELTHAASYLNSEFAGLPLWQVREAIVDRLQQERTLYDVLLSRALTLASATFADMPARSALFVQGVSLLLDDAFQGDERIPVSTLRVLFDLIEEKDRLVQLLNGYIDGPGLTIIIGTEHRAPDLQNFSLIASTYFDGHQTGCVGVIGPRRMRYSQTIAAVDSLSRTVSRLLITDGGHPLVN